MIGSKRAPDYRRKCLPNKVLECASAAIPGHNDRSGNVMIPPVEAAAYAWARIYQVRVPPAKTMCAVPLVRFAETSP